MRILAQNAEYHASVGYAQTLLAQMKLKTGLPFAFLLDDQDVSGLPGWVRTGGQTTDGHLMQLAQAHDAMLATLHLRIPGAFVIPRS